MEWFSSCAQVVRLLGVPIWACTALEELEMQFYREFSFRKTFYTIYSFYEDWNLSSLIRSSKPFLRIHATMPNYPL
jgi:hypothetical protein